MRLIRPVYGPSANVVLNAGATGRSAPELLTDGATIARRLVEVEDRVENVGTMFLRGLLWEIHDLVGDGTSTAAIVFAAMFEEGRRGIAAGLNASRLRYFLLERAKLLDPALDRQRITVSDQPTLKCLAQSVSGDASLAGAVSEIHAGLGAYGHVEVRPGKGSDLGYEFIGDSFWPSNCLDSAMMPGVIGQRIELSNCALFVSDLDIQDAQDFVPVLAAARTPQVTSLIILGRSISKQCVGLLMSNSSPAFRIFAMRTPEATEFDRSETMDDIATLTGATVFRHAAGASSVNVQGADLGSCRRAWISRTHFGLCGGQGKSRVIRRRISELRAQVQSVGEDKQTKQARLRLSRLTAKSAILLINGTTDREIEQRKALGERTSRVTQNAIVNGALPGGGAALLECRRFVGLRELSTDEPEEVFALKMMIQGLEAPIRTLAQNGGLEPSVAVMKAKDAGPGHAIDVTTGRIVDMSKAGILDSFDVVSTALQKATAGVAQALTIETVVLRQSPSKATTP